MDVVSFTVEASVGLLRSEKMALWYSFWCMWNYGRKQEVEIALGIGMRASEHVIKGEVIVLVKSNCTRRLSEAIDNCFISSTTFP
jgi:hypothetical protein